MRLFPLIVTLAALVTTHAAAALTADKDKPINIQADSAVVDERNGVSTYSGNVKVDQGSLQITADQVKVHSRENQVVQIVASAHASSEGFAHYQQQPEDADLVEAKAREITYFVNEERVKLIGSARLSQTTDRSFSGETIDYFIKRGLVNAEGGADGRTITTFKQKPR